ncbi:MAG: hypothetical protein GX768_00260 [Chloroflexi bacterium]|nr:hypothetical protein [Chloroflexota bacterium]
MQALAETAVDDTYIEKEGVDVIYLAGGCFWGVEKMMQSIPGWLPLLVGTQTEWWKFFLPTIGSLVVILATVKLCGLNINQTK